MEGEADHILAAHFLMRFIEDAAWLHMDLSASNCRGGLGAVASVWGGGWNCCAGCKKAGEFVAPQLFLCSTKVDQRCWPSCFSR
jgi:hypothetical protein